jgi:hypothetical protein
MLNNHVLQTQKGNIMSKQLTHEQHKGALLKEYDGFAKMAKRDPDLCVDLAMGVFGRLNGGDYNSARAKAETAVETIHMMSRGEFGFDRAAKTVQEYFPAADDHFENTYIDDDIP